MTRDALRAELAALGLKLGDSSTLEEIPEGFLMVWTPRDARERALSWISERRYVLQQEISFHAGWGTWLCVWTGEWPCPPA